MKYDRGQVQCFIAHAAFGVDIYLPTDIIAVEKKERALSPKIPFFNGNLIRWKVYVHTKPLQVEKK